MAFDRDEIFDKLKQELKILEAGGYDPSTEPPYRMPEVFRDSVSCPNVGVEFKLTPCSECFLIYFVPPEHRGQENPCHYIPLNKAGDTVASLRGRGNEGQLRAALRTWLRATLFSMVADPERIETAMEEHLLSTGDRKACLLLSSGDQTSSSYSVARRG
jgi:hypothetical protein